MKLRERWKALKEDMVLTFFGIQYDKMPPLYLYYIKSAWLGWMTAALGMALREGAEWAWKRWNRQKSSRPDGGG